MAKKALEPAAGLEPAATLPAIAEAAPVSAEPAQEEPEQAEAETAEPEQAEPEQGPALRVRSAHGRTRYRAGRAFSNEPVEIAIADLTEDELAALQADPQLKIEEA